MEINKIYNVDILSENGLKSIPSNSIDMCFIDPPYKLTGGGCKNTKMNGQISGRVNPFVTNGSVFKHNLVKPKDYFSEIFRVLKERTHFYCMCNDKHLKDVLFEGEKAGFKEVNVLVWKKGMHTPTQYYMKNIEFIVLFRKGKAKYINNMGSFALIDIVGIRGNKVHPSQKPVELISHLIENSSNEGNIILDCFMGSGASAISCIETNRRYIGFEIDSTYCELANKRVEDYISQSH